MEINEGAPEGQKRTLNPWSLQSCPLEKVTVKSHLYLYLLRNPFERPLSFPELPMGKELEDPSLELTSEHLWLCLPWAAYISRIWLNSDFSPGFSPRPILLFGSSIGL